MNNNPTHTYNIVLIPNYDSRGRGYLVSGTTNHGTIKLSGIEPATLAFQPASYTPRLGGCQIIFKSQKEAFKKYKYSLFTV